MSFRKSKPVSGPYRATKLWNDAVRSFYNEMPLSRHWRGLRQYENCFTAAEAITWLHNYLLSNPNFGPAVTRDQSLKLLRKFVKSGLVIEARGNKVYADDFEDNRELFRFSNQSPLKALRTPSRTPLAPIIANALSNCGSSPKLKSDKLERSNLEEEKFGCDSNQENISNEEKDSNFSSLSYKHLSEEEICKVWQETFHEKLESVSEHMNVGGDGSAPLLSIQSINAVWIRHNMTLLRSKGISRVEGFCSDELPDWILSAMRCLVHWPNSPDSVCNIPSYPGVEVDVFKVVMEFFSSMVIPLIPYDLYDPIVRLYIGAEFLDIIHRTPDRSLDEAEPDPLNQSISSYDSVEDLILDISVCGAPESSSPARNSEKDSPQEGKCVGKVTRSSGAMEKRIPRNHTPLSCRVNSGYNSIPRSLRLNKLQNYTNFKDSYLYPEDGASFQSNKSHNSGGNESLGTSRVTLKFLKNRSKLGSRSNEVKPDVSNGESSSYTKKSSPSFKEILKTEELDDFSLPPNSCFETAFTSNTPKTRIIPQKSVDTIHFRHFTRSLRPKSIAVSSLALPQTKSWAHLEDVKSTPSALSESCAQINSSFMNRSLSEGNLLSSVKEFESSYTDSSNSIEPAKELKGSNIAMKKSSSGSKSSLASRVRDSIKRKKVKDTGSSLKRFSRSSSQASRQSSYCNSTETLTSLNATSSTDPDDFSLRLKRLRTKSGGYANPALSLRSFSPTNTSSTQSYVSDIDSFGSTCGPLADPHPAHSRLSSVLSECQEPPGSVRSSSILSDASCPSDASFCSLRRTCIRSKSCTPDGCLSHSLASSATIYHSALSGLNQTSLSLHTSANKKPCQSDSSSASERPLSTPISTPPPELPKRMPTFQTSPHSAFGLLPPLQSRAADPKPLSSSANELSDDWTDRTPFGAAPPYVRGGLWRHYYSSPSKRLMERANRLQKACGNDACLPGLLTKMGKEICVEALQLITLILEPGRRRRLYLLLKMMSRIAANEKLQLDAVDTNRSLMVKKFTRSVLLSDRERNYDELLSTRIVTFMMDNHTAIFTPPQHLAVLVHRKMGVGRKKVSSKQTGALSSSSPSLPITYCHQVSPQTYEKQKFTGSQQFLSDLLDQIIHNSKLSDKEKRKKMKEFKVHYPEIYDHKFPPGRENDLAPSDKKSKFRGLKKFASIKSLTRSKSIRI